MLHTKDKQKQILEHLTMVKNISTVRDLFVFTHLKIDYLKIPKNPRQMNCKISSKNLGTQTTKKRWREQDGID